LEIGSGSSLVEVEDWFIDGRGGESPFFRVSETFVKSRKMKILLKFHQKSLVFWQKKFYICLIKNQTKIKMEKQAYQVSLVTERTIHYESMTEKITSGQDVYEVLKKVYDSFMEDHEEFWVVALNRSNVISGLCRISVGGVSQTIVDLKQVFKFALLCNASSIILSHNHPSGNILPSNEDHALTEKIKKACSVMDITLLDHIILTRDSFTSFKNEGYL
jgi:DNA repair protein RadC